MFEHSKPIWIQGADGEMNGLYAFVFPFTAGREEISVHIAACDVYQAYCNGEFIATGLSFFRCQGLYLTFFCLGKGGGTWKRPGWRLWQGELLEIHMRD